MFGNNLKKLRKACGFKQDDVAQVLGIDRSAYSYYEGEKTQPNILNLIKIARMYRVDVDTLVGNSEHTKALNAGQAGDSLPTGEIKLDSELNTDIDLDELGKCSSEEKELIGWFRQITDKKEAIAAVKALALNAVE